MRIAVIGAGPAGLAAAYRLAEEGHEVTVFEAEKHAGGRTRTIHWEDGHWLDTGAGWLTNFYPSVRALVREARLDVKFSPLKMRGGGDQYLNGQRYASPNSILRILTTPLISLSQKIRFFLWMARLMLTQRSNLRIDRSYDDVPAVEALSGMGVDARDRIVRPNFEGPFFARLEQMNGTLVRSWLRNLSVGSFYQVDNGMDWVWRRLADRLDVRFGSRVTKVIVGKPGGPAVLIDERTEDFDRVVVAVPAPIAAELLGDSAPRELSDVEYAPHVRVYVARPNTERVPRKGIHVFPNDTVATVERGSGGEPAWGRVPRGWEWALLCAPSASSGALLELGDEALLDRMFDMAKSETGEDIPWRAFEIVHVVRWEHAVPIVGVGYYQRVDSVQAPDGVYFAGDWKDQPCVEGAVRSGLETARELLDDWRQEAGTGR